MEITIRNYNFSIPLPQKNPEENPQELLCIVEQVSESKGLLTTTDNKCIGCFIVVLLFVFKALTDI